MRRKFPRWVGSMPIIVGAANAALAQAQNTAFSTNWSGYYATAPTGDTFTDISSTWVVPTIRNIGTAPAYSADWVGFDGATDLTVEQCGTSGDLLSSNGSTSYYAWYEFYSLPEVQIPSSTLAIHAGDTISAEVTYEAGESSTGNYGYLFSINDLTDSQSFVDTIFTGSNDPRSSAEWIAEAPTVNGSQGTFANYGSVTFSSDEAAAVPAGSTSVGTDQPIGVYSPIEVIAEQSNTYVSVPTSLNSTGDAFNIIAAHNLIWNNTSATSPSDGMTWDLHNNNNWSTDYTTGSGNITTTYSNGVNVTFNDFNNGHYAVTLNTSLRPVSVSVAASGNYTISGAGSIIGTGYLIKTGTGTLTLSTANTYTGGTTITNGRLLIEPTPTGPTTCALPAGALSISGSVVQLADNVSAGTALAASNVNLTSLSITNGGALDIGNNRVIIDYSSSATDPIASIAAWVKNGFNKLSGPVIFSSDVTTDDAASGLSYGIGYADGADGTVTGLPSGEIELMYTLLGDANLDGTVNSEDFTQLSQHLNQTGYWDQGDFNYDGTVNIEDFTPFSVNLNQSAAFAAQAGVLQSADSISLANVPEPTSAAIMIAVAGAGFLRRRRRSSQ